MKPLTLCMLGLLLTVSSVSAVPPHPPSCTCTLDDTGRLYICPDGFGTWPHPSGAFYIEVRDATGALVAPATVRVAVGGQLGGFTVLCPGAITQITTPTGMVQFNIPGGGCYKNQPGAVTIDAHDGSGSWVIIRQYSHIMSSDYANSDNNGIPFMWDRCVTPQDLAAFAAAYQGGTGPASCHDYDNDGVTSPADLAVFVAAYRGGANCC